MAIIKLKIIVFQGFSLVLMDFIPEMMGLILQMFFRVLDAMGE